MGIAELASLGLGATIGTGIFVVIGEAMGTSGPSIVLAFALAAFACFLSALSFAELTSLMPLSGSAYTYAYVAFGELIAWIIGWDMMLEYGLSVAAVAVGWGQYVADFLDTTFGLQFPLSLTAPINEGGIINLPAIVVVLAMMSLLLVGIKETAHTNTVMVVIKVSVLLMFVVLAFSVSNSDNFHPFFTGGFHGVVTAASLIFFSYIGFEAISTSGEEARRPQRDLPLAILIALGVTTLLYCLIALAASGVMSVDEIKRAKAPLAAILRSGIGPLGAQITSLGAAIAIASVVLTVLYSQTRIAYGMAQNGLLPRPLATLSKARQTPVIATLTFGVVIACVAATASLRETAELVNIGTLFAFCVVNAGVLVLRIRT